MFVKKIIEFFKNVKKEMKNVRWPNRKEMLLYSVATFGCIIFFSLFFTLITAIIGLVEMVLV